MPTRTKAELLAENERLQKRVAALERAKARSGAASKKIRQLRTDLLESEQQQTATAEILRVISSSPTDTQPVFDAIAESAARLCNANDAVIRRVDGDVLCLAAHFGSLPVVRPTVRISPGSPGGRAILECRTIHIDDVVEDRVREEYPDVGSTLHLLVAPLLREGAAIGTISIRRPDARPFSAKQVELLETFAAQAVIAIENVRLFKELQARNADLTEALEQQTATSEILRVISQSPTDVQPVFDAVAESAARLCGAYDVVIRLVGADGHYAVAHHGPIPVNPPHVITRANMGGRAIIDARTVHVPDISAAHVREEFPEIRASTGYRTFLAVPLLREGKAIGLIVMRRQEVRPFTDKQIQLLETFAAQAVIAIENVRLFNETQQALEQQTVVSEILRVISSSPTDVQPVFEAIVKSGVHLFGGMNVTLRLVKGDHIETVATTNPLYDVGSELPDLLDDEGMPGSRAILRREVVQIPDYVTAEQWVSPTARQRAEKRGFRALMSAPMLRESNAIGTINVIRATPGPFSAKQAALLQIFADQAVIAIENVRLFKELQARNIEVTEALEQQTATADILKVISSSPTDTQPVFDAVAESAARLCEAHDVVIRLVVGNDHCAVAHYGPIPVMPPHVITRWQLGGRAIVDAQTVHIPDVTEADVQEEFRESFSATTGQRTFLAVPLLRKGKAIGLIVMRRLEVRPFTDNQIKLLETFADQAVIAIENVRLFKELAARNAEITEALEQQTATSEILRVISSSPTDIQPVFDAILENATRLCDAHMAILRLYDGERFHRVAQRGFTPEFAKWVLAESDKYAGHPEGMSRQMIAAKQPIHTLDYREAASYRNGHPPAVAGVELGGIRTGLAVPMKNEERLFGAIAVYRPEVRAFTQKQIDLVSTFADQAVIAIENVRLFKELAARTDSLARSVAQLTALGEVGQAISSTLDLETVLKTIATRAIELSGQDAGVIYEYDPAAEAFELRAAQNFDANSVARLRGAAIRKGVGAVGTCVVTREPTQVPDTHVPDYPGKLREILDLAGFRAVLAVPLLREDQIIGALMVIRKTPGPFGTEVVQLLETFASQSALAIQNARLFREIADKGRQLEVASRHKSDFLASMSHELRTPLNAILGFIELILDQIYGEVPADLQEPLTDIQASGKHLLRLINNVLDLAKIEAGRMELALAEYSVQDTVEGVRQTLRPLAADKGLEFLATVPPDLPFAHGDPGRITQCLMNLAGNSLKFTKAGKVVISVEQQGERLVFRVADTGIGIAPDKIDSLFTEFKQTDATIAGEYGGTGLGLSISRKFVEMHGGRIWVESELGHGSTFIFELPLRAGEPR